MQKFSTATLQKVKRTAEEVGYVIMWFSHQVVLGRERYVDEDGISSFLLAGWD